MIEESLYVDDLISGGENESKAFEIYQSSKCILAEGSFNLRKWHSNSRELLDRIHQAEAGDGINQHSKDDIKPKSITEEDQSYTKSTIGSDNREKEVDVVNVLGTKWDCKTDELCFNLSSIVEKMGWDDPLEGIGELECLNAVRIPRCYFDSQSHPTETQIHAFSHASNTAYAAVVYTRSSYENGNVQVRLVASICAAICAKSEK
jgi:hypothetical protein